MQYSVKLVKKKETRYKIKSIAKTFFFLNMKIIAFNLGQDSLGDISRISRVSICSLKSKNIILSLKS